MGHRVRGPARLEQPRPGRGKGHAGLRTGGSVRNCPHPHPRPTPTPVRIVTPFTLLAVYFFEECEVTMVTERGFFVLLCTCQQTILQLLKHATGLPGFLLKKIVPLPRGGGCYGQAEGQGIFDPPEGGICCQGWALLYPFPQP